MEECPRRIAVYPGSFDPLTNGHIDILKRAKPLFDKIVVLIAVNSQKKGLFSIEERVRVLNEVFDQDNVITVDQIQDDLMVHYCKDNKVSAIIRGLRAVGDFEYEYAITMMNRRLAPNVETIFFMTSEQYSFISSTIVKEVASYGRSVEDLVPASVHKYLSHKFSHYPRKES